MLSGESYGTYLRLPQRAPIQSHGRNRQAANAEYSRSLLRRHLSSVRIDLRDQLAFRSDIQGQAAGNAVLGNYT